MSLRHAIVGFLIERPMHGYELKRALSPALGREGLVNDGILYPILSKLVADGLLKKRIEKVGSGPNRHVMFPTAKGQKWFREWLESSEGEEDEITYDFFLFSPFLAKCVFFGKLSNADIVNKLDDQLVSAKAKLKTFDAIRNKLVARNVDAHRVAVLDLGIVQQKQRVKWLALQRARAKDSLLP